MAKLKKLVLCAGIFLLSIVSAMSENSVIGKWQSIDGDFMEFRNEGVGSGYNKRFHALAIFKWKIVGKDAIKFIHPLQELLSQTCKFTIHGDVITFYKCPMATSRGIVNSWSGKKKIITASAR